jgi:hypothetical protein
MHDHDWHDTLEQAFACRLEAEDQPALWIGFNPCAQDRRFTLPRGCWQLELDSACVSAGAARQVDTMTVPAHALVVLLQADPDHREPSA